MTVVAEGLIFELRAHRKLVFGKNANSYFLCVFDTGARDDHGRTQQEKLLTVKKDNFCIDYYKNAMLTNYISPKFYY